jgi:hypothetical protein
MKVDKKGALKFLLSILIIILNVSCVRSVSDVPDVPDVPHYRYQGQLTIERKQVWTGTCSLEFTFKNLSSYALKARIKYIVFDNNKNTLQEGSLRFDTVLSDKFQAKPGWPV